MSSQRYWRKTSSEASLYQREKNVLIRREFRKVSKLVRVLVKCGLKYKY